MPITPPLGVLEQKNFGFPSFSIGGTFTPKMIKIGEIRVLSYFDLSWNEPYVKVDVDIRKEYCPEFPSKIGDNVSDKVRRWLLSEIGGKVRDKVRRGLSSEIVYKVCTYRGKL